MAAMNQSAALVPELLGSQDRARFWREPRHDGLECLTASFRQHRYAPHTHDTYVIGIIEAGWEAYRLEGRPMLAGPGDLCFVNPGELHDGEPHGAGYAYRMTYPSEDLLAAVAEDIGASRIPPRFTRAVVQDPEAAALFGAAHCRMEAGAGSLGADEALIAAYGLLLKRHAAIRLRPPPADAPPAVRRARDYLESHLAEDVDLATLARVAGLTRSHLVRSFKRATGMTPHAYLVDRRVRQARRLLAAGTPPVAVAAACGFCDQSHLNRLFKARVGVAPGAFRVA